MSIDDRNILSKLRRMGDDELTQFAQTNQANPYLFPLAFQESQDRKEIRLGSGILASDKRGDTPSVKDQALMAMASPAAAPQTPPMPPQGMPPQGMPPQGMPPPQQAPQPAMPPPQGQTQMAANGGYMDSRLPEEMGIGALPERSLSNMADGGIVGFNEGGDVQRFQSGGTPIGRLFQGIGQSIDTSYETAELKNALAKKYGAASALPGMFQEQTDAERANAKAIMGRLDSLSPTEMRFVLENGALPQGSSTFQPYERNRKGNAPFAASVASAPAAGAAPPYDPAMATRRDQYANKNAGPGAAPGAGAMSIAELQKLQKSLIPTSREADPYAVENAAKAKIRKEQGDLELADSETRKAGLAALLAPQEQRLKDRESRLQKNDDMNVNMSLINAGLAMMQATGSGLSGIAKGAEVGVKQYSEGLKLSEAARQKIEDAQDAFARLKYSEGAMAQKDVTAAKRTIAEGAIASTNETIAGVEKATGLKRADAKDVFDNFVKSREGGLDRASRERTASFSAQVQKEIASMPGAQEKLFATLGGGDAKKGFEYFTAATNEGKGDEALMQFVLKTPEILSNISPALRKIIEQRITERFAPAAQNTPTGKALP